MWHVLRLRHQINVPRQLVESLLREVDPRGVEHRESHCLQCRTYVSPGPNFCWHMDGYNKLKPFGFSIHSCVDGFSRRILWLEMQQSNKNPQCVASYFVKHVKAAHGCPVRVHTDQGTRAFSREGLSPFPRFFLGGTSKMASHYVRDEIRAAVHREVSRMLGSPSTSAMECDISEGASC